jgi:hypothetical protein
MPWLCCNDQTNTSLSAVLTVHAGRETRDDTLSQAESETTATVRFAPQFRLRHMCLQQT